MNKSPVTYKLSDETPTYEKNGNIQSLQRKGKAGAVYTTIDQLSYKYNGNRLLAVNDLDATATQANGFTDNGLFKTGNPTDPLTHEYTYDVNGNLMDDANKMLHILSYNYLNLPDSIDFENDLKIKYLYASGGAKLRQITYYNGTPTEQLDYSGNFVYENSSLKYILTSEGRLLPTANGFEREYFLSDHLGNTRVIFKKSGDTTAIVQENHYYAYGMEIADQSFSSTPVPNTFLYNGKEFDSNTGYYQYGFRQYDAQIGRWHTIDPSAASYHSFSPYHFAGCNPVGNRELNGADYFSQMYQTSDYFWYRGSLVTSGGSTHNQQFDYQGGGGSSRGGGFKYDEKYGLYRDASGNVVSWGYVFYSWLSTGQLQSLTRTQEGWAGQGVRIYFTGSAHVIQTKPIHSVDEIVETNILWVWHVEFFDSNWRGYSGSYSSDDNYNEWRINDAFSIAGLAWGVTENSIYNNYFWLGKNGKYYSFETWKYGNQYTGSSFQAAKYAKPAKLLGKVTFAVNLAFGISGVYSGIKENDYSKSFFSALGTTYSGIATFGGPAGMFIGGPMVAIDATIGLDKFFQSSIDLNIERANRISQGDYSMMWYTVGRTIR